MDLSCPDIKKEKLKISNKVTLYNYKMNPSETFIIIDYFIALFLRLLLRFLQD